MLGLISFVNTTLLDNTKYTRNLLVWGNLIDGEGYATSVNFDVQGRINAEACFVEPIAFDIDPGNGDDGAIAVSGLKITVLTVIEARANLELAVVGEFAYFLARFSFSRAGL